MVFFCASRRAPISYATTRSESGFGELVAMLAPTCAVAPDKPAASEIQIRQEVRKPRICHLLLSSRLREMRSLHCGDCDRKDLHVPRAANDPGVWLLFKEMVKCSGAQNGQRLQSLH